MNSLVPREFFERLWKVNVHLLRARFKRWKNQRCYFIAADDSFIWKVIEAETKDQNLLPKDYIVVNAIYAGHIWRKPKSFGGWEGVHDRYTVLEFRDVIYSWVNRKGDACTATQSSIFGHGRKHRDNKKRTWCFPIEEILSGGLTLKQIKAGLASVDRSLAGGVALLEAL